MRVDLVAEQPPCPMTLHNGAIQPFGCHSSVIRIFQRAPSVVLHLALDTQSANHNEKDNPTLPLVLKAITALGLVTETLVCQS